MNDIEAYFIQFLFIKNRELLKAKYRELYDNLFTRYKENYELGKKHHMDLGDIEKRFQNTLFENLRKIRKQINKNPGKRV